MPFPLCQWIIETIYVCFQVIFFPFYGTDSLYQQSTHYQYHHQHDIEEDVDLIDVKKRMYDRVPFYGRFFRYSTGANSTPSLEKAHPSPPPVAHPTHYYPTTATSTTIDPTPQYSIPLPRPHHHHHYTETDQTRQRRGSHTNSSSTSSNNAVIGILHPALKGSPDARQRKQFAGDRKQQTPSFPTELLPSLAMDYDFTNETERLPTVKEEDSPVPPVNELPAPNPLSSMPVTERTTEFGVGLRGSQPLVRLDRFTILSASQSNNQYYTASSSFSTQVDPSTHNMNANYQHGQGNYQSPSAFPVHPSQSKREISSATPRRHDPSLPVIAYSEITFVQAIGTGGFGQVWKALWKGTPVAVKALNQICQASTVADKVLISFEEEVSMLARLRHPNICLLLGVCLEPSHRMIITELVSRGSLWEALRTPHLVQSDGKFFWPAWVIKRILEGAGRGLIYLHSHNPPIIHRDLKSPNLLLDDSFNVKICDFGLAKLRDLTTILTANVGTVQWMAPEVLTGNAYSESADIYSMGLVLWEMLTGKCPYEGMKQVEIALAVVNTQLRPTLPLKCSVEQVTFIQRCWAHNPQDRPSAEGFIQQVNRIFV